LSKRQLRLESPTTPRTQRLPAITRTRFSLFRFRSPLLAESRLFSLPAGNEMFHFPAFPPLTLCVQVRVTGHDPCRVSPFGNPWITARLAAPQGLSQPPTSFIGSWCQGIHRAPLLTWPQRCSRPLCSSQGTGGAETLDPRARGRHRGLRGGSGPLPGRRIATDSKWSGPRRALPGLRAGVHPVPQDPTACRGRRRLERHRSRRRTGCTRRSVNGAGQLVSDPPLSSTTGANARCVGLDLVVRGREARCSLERR
jgi:hypothetical protein